MLNPSEVFGDIMIDYSYVECSSACITALQDFSLAIPNYRSAEVLNSIQAGRTFLKSIQRSDGSWYGKYLLRLWDRFDIDKCSYYITCLILWYALLYSLGSWGTCFTYGTWFGIEGLICAGESPFSPAIQKAISFILSKQNLNGGWGESYLACINKDYPIEGTGEVRFNHVFS